MSRRGRQLERPRPLAALRAALQYVLAGNGRTVTMRAYTETEFVRVTKSLT
jgi:uncharacterized protein with GYD domain